MTDPELLALTAVVNARRVGMEAANVTSERNGFAPAYSDDTQWPDLDALEEEMKRRLEANTPAVASGGDDG